MHAAPLPVPSEPLHDAPDPRAEAARAFARGEHERAASLLSAELERRPAHPDAALLFNDLGVALAHLGRGEAALKAFAEALRVDPRHPDARANLRDVSRALHASDDGRAHPVAPGAWGRMVRRDPIDDLAALIDLAAPGIVDGGAHRGHVAARLRAAFPAAWIHAFEPQPEPARRLRERFAADARVRVHEAALASRAGRVAFHANAGDLTSSRFAAGPLSGRYNAAATELRARIEVEAVRLDQAVAGPIDVVKLDLQGGELDALIGLGERLAGARALLVEVELAPLYAGQPLLTDVDLFLREKGFFLYQLYDLWTHPDGRLTAGDALFLNRRWYRAE